MRTRERVMVVMRGLLASEGVNEGMHMRRDQQAKGPLGKSITCLQDYPSLTEPVQNGRQDQGARVGTMPADSCSTP